MTAARRLDSSTVSARGDAGDLADLAFVAILGLLGIVGFRTVYGGWSWLVDGGCGLVAGIALGIVGRRRRLDPLVVGLATAAVYFGLSGVAIADQSVAGVVPTATTLRGAASGAVWGWAQLLTTVPPIGSHGALGVVPLLCAIAAGVLATSAALRTTGIVRPLAPLVALVVVAILFGTDEPASLVLQGGAFAAVAIAWVAYRRRGTRATAAATVGRGRLLGGVLMVSLAAVVATVAGDHLPGAGANHRYILREQSEPPFDPKQHPSPLASFRHYKDDQTQKGLRDDTVFTVSGLPKGVPLRLAVMDAYDGVVWKVSGSSSDATGTFERVGSTIPVTARGSHARVQLTVGDYNDIWVPDLGTVSGIQFGGPRAAQLSDALRYNATMGVGAVPLRFAKGDRIVVDATWTPWPKQEDLKNPYSGKRAAASDGATVEQSPEELKELAERLLASGPNPTTMAEAKAQAAGVAPPTGAPEPPEVAPGYDSVRRIAREFVEAPAYGYCDGRPAEQATCTALAGHSRRRMQSMATDVLDQGLTYGNDEQYASALALIAHELNVPARVVMGFCKDGCENGVVRGQDVSAWVEISLDGIGWVPLDATPPQDKQDLAPVKPKPTPKPNNASQPPPPPVTTPPPMDVNADDTSGNDRDTGSDGLFGIPLAWIAGVGTPLLIVGGFVAGVLSLKQRRRRRRREQGDEMHRIVGGWRELDDRALDLGRPLPVRVTRREIATYLGSEAAMRSATMADAAIFGPSVPSPTELADYWASIDAAYDWMAEEESGLRRLRADLNPASLIRASRRTSTWRSWWARHGRGRSAAERAEAVSVAARVDLRESVDA